MDVAVTGLGLRAPGDQLDHSAGKLGAELRKHRSGREIERAVRQTDEEVSRLRQDLEALPCQVGQLPGQKYR